MKNNHFIKMLTERVMHKVRKKILESVSDKVYHYTDLNAITKIISSDTMLFQSASHGQENHGDKQPFFMSTTRNKNPFEGFAGQKYKKMGGYVARIEFNGRMLNSRFKGYPIDFWYDKSLDNPEFRLHTGKQHYYDGLSTYKFNNYSQKHYDFEAEDRVMFNEPSMKGISKYVTRIDILLPNYSDKKIFDTVAPIAANIFKNNENFNVYFYGDLKNFCFQTNNTINQELKNMVEGYESNYEEEEDDLDPEMLADVLVFIVAKEGDGNDAYDLLMDYGLDYYDSDDYMWECFDYGIKAPLNVIGELMEKATLMLTQPTQTRAKVMKMFGDYMRKHGFRNIQQAIEYKKNL